MMEYRNVFIIAGLLFLIIGTTYLFDNEKSNNKAIKVSATSVNMEKIELPFLYRHKLFKEKTLNEKVKKDDVTSEEDVKTSNDKEIKKEENYASNEIDNSVIEYESEIYKNVPLSNDLKKYIKKKSLKYSISHTLIFAVIKMESNFNAKLISYTRDYGLMQINIQNFTDVKNEIGPNWSWEDPYQNVDAGIYLLAGTRDAWINHVNNKDLIPVALLSYNMGVARAKKYMTNHSVYDWLYVKKILDYKKKIENGEKI